MPREGGSQKRILLNGENTFASAGRRIEASVVTLLSVIIEGDFNLLPLLHLSNFKFARNSKALKCYLIHKGRK